MKVGMRRAGPNEVNPIRSFGFLLTMIVVMLVTGGVMPQVRIAALLGLILNVGTSTVLGDQLYIYSINKIGASLAVSVSNVYPLITTFVSLLVLNETITPLIWVGTVLLILGIIVITHSPGGKHKGVEMSRKDKYAVRTVLTGFALALGAALCYGVNTPFVKVLMIQGGWNPIQLYFLRSLVYIVLVWSLRGFENLRIPHILMPFHKMRPKTFWAFFAAGCVGLALGGIFFGVCIEVLPVSVVTPITSSSPFVTVLISRFFYREKLTKLQNIGVGLVILGSISVSL
jgi:uncharacterized membrane protein